MKTKPKSIEISRPRDGTTCAKIWAIADKYKGNRQAVLKECASRKINAATVSTQYGRWRVFNGITGRSIKTVKKGPPARKVAAKKAPPRKKPAVVIPPTPEPSPVE